MPTKQTWLSLLLWLTLVILGVLAWNSLLAPWFLQH
jgi:hypothetical protein